MTEAPDIVELLIERADALRWDDGTDLPLGEELREAAVEIERLRAALADVKERCAKVAEALDAYRAYIDSSDQELADACVTRKELLRKARELDPYDGKTPVATTIRGLE